MTTTLDPSYGTKNYEKQGGDSWIVGGTIDIAQAAGGKITVDGVDVTSAVATGGVAGVAAGYKLARGVHQQAAAVDTVATGLATVVACVATWQDGPTVKQMWLGATIGDQAGSPVAGSINISSWKPTSNVNDSTPTAATDFTENRKVNWIAIGT